jgi:membrane associated rhomboid family serine protease
MFCDTSTLPATALLLKLQLLGQLTVGIWALFLFNEILLGGRLKQLGLIPRHWGSLWRIPIASVLHVDAPHLVGNTMFFWILGGLLMIYGVRDFTLVSLAAMMGSGVGTWLFGRRARHMGLSGVLFGYLGFLLLRGYFEKNAVSALLAILTGAFYGRLLWGILPKSGRVSWEGHLFGFLGGAAAAAELDQLRSLWPLA